MTKTNSRKEEACKYPFCLLINYYVSHVSIMLAEKAFYFEKLGSNNAKVSFTAVKASIKSNSIFFIKLIKIIKVDVLGFLELHETLC